MGESILALINGMGIMQFKFGTSSDDSNLVAYCYGLLLLVNLNRFLYYQLVLEDYYLIFLKLA